jgi:hypothetical protein
MQENNKTPLIANEKLNKLFLFLLKKKDFLFYGFFIIMLVGIVFYKVGGRLSKGDKEKLAVVETTYDKWKNSSDEKSLEDLQAFIQKYPSLLTKYESVIAQDIIWEKENFSSKEKLVAEHALKRVEKELPLYSKYAKTTLLISEKKYEEALKQSFALKKELQDIAFVQKDEMAGPVLYVYNLLRITNLQKDLKNKVEEIKALQETKDYITAAEKSENLSLRTSIKAFLKRFAENKIELVDYLSYRINQLK